MRKNETVEKRPWRGEPRRLPLKYHERALLPCQVTRGDEGAWEYLTTDGARVSLKCVATFNGQREVCLEELKKECRELYGMDFAAIEAVWARRIGRLDGWWNIVHLVRVDATEGE